jgi:hypothetical protein
MHIDLHLQDEGSEDSSDSFSATDPQDHVKELAKDYS